MGTDNDGYQMVVESITISNPGSGYEDTYTGGSPNITSFYGGPNPIVVNNSITLQWNVVNADIVTLLGYDSYGELPSVGSLSVPIMDTEITFGPNEEFQTKTFTLQATKTNTAI